MSSKDEKLAGATSSPPPETAFEAANETATAEERTAPAKLSNGLDDQSAFLPTKTVLVVFIGLSIATACTFLEQTIVSTALYHIVSELKSGKESSWVATAYLLTSVALTPIFARWSDIFGRKQMLILALVVFWVSSLACALSQSMLQLIIFRGFQGVGAAGINLVVLIIIGDIVSLKNRGKFMGVLEISIATANGIGPLLGAVFSQYTSWRFAFWINLPLAGIAIVLTVWLLPLRGVTGNLREKFLKIDYLGSILTVVGSILILLGLSWGGVTYSWVSASVLAPLLVGGFILAGFLIWEAKWATLPIVPVHLFHNLTVVGVLICTTATAMTFFSLMYQLPNFMQLVRGDSYVKASAFTIALLLPISVFIFTSGQIIARTGHYRWMIIGGHAMWCIAQGLQSTIDLKSSDAMIVGVLVMAGISSGFTFQTEIVAAQAAVPRHEMAVVTGLRNFVRLLGSTIALAVNGAVINNALRSGVSSLGMSAAVVERLLEEPTIINQPEFRAALTDEQHHGILSAYLKGFKVVFLLTVAENALATLAAYFFIKQHELRRSDDKALKEQGRDLLRKRKENRDKDDVLESAEAKLDDRELALETPADTTVPQFESKAAVDKPVA